MRSLLLVFAALTLAFAAVSINAEPIESRVVIVYPVSDLPVWSLKEGERTPQFDPSVLTTLITTTLDVGYITARWNIATHEKSHALVISASRADHSRVANLLKSLRGQDSDEIRNVPTKQKVSSRPRGINVQSHRVFHQLEQPFHPEQVPIPLDLEVLSDRLIHEATAYVLVVGKELDGFVWNESDRLTHRDFHIGGVTFTR